MHKTFVIKKEKAAFRFTKVINDEKQFQYEEVKKLHKGKWENILLSVLYFRRGIWKVSEDLSEADRQGKGGRSHPGGLGESNQREKNIVRLPSPSQQIPNL